MTDTASRQPKGIPVGGRFAPTAHAEPEATLAAPALPRPPETQQDIRGHDFYPPAEEMAGWPGIYDTEEVPVPDKPIVAHWFQGSIDVWACEYSGGERNEAFGYIDMGVGHGEWGYIPLGDLEAVRGQYGLPIERDLDFTPGTPAKECIPKYRQEAALATVVQPAGPDDEEPPLWDGPDEPDPLTPEERKKWDDRHRFAYDYGHSVLGVTGFEDRDTVEEFAGFAADAYRESGWNEDLDMHGVVDDWMAHRHPQG